MIRAILASKWSIIRTGLGAGAAAGALFAFTLGPAIAAPSGVDPTPAPTAASRAQRADERLDRLYQREQKVLAAEQKVLDRTNDVIARAQARIDQATANGKDTSALKSALDAFKSAVQTAQGQHDIAKSALDTHAGFDASGKVTDASQARNTLKTAGAAMRDFHKTMKKARADLRKAVRDFVKDNRRDNRAAQKPR